MNVFHSLRMLALCAAGLATAAHAALPAPTPAQQQAAAAKKAQTDAQAAKDKESLTASMDDVSKRWRVRAAGQGWQTHPAVAIAAAPAPASAGGVSAPLAGNAPAGQPGGNLTQAGTAVPIRSEKLGTAPPSADVKKQPTRAQPAGAAPTVVKSDTPQLNNRK
jgi:hypothetical protein